MNGVRELRLAIERYDRYYAARLELGRELRKQKLYEEAIVILQPLSHIAPKKPEPRVLNAASLLALGHRERAAEELRVALTLDDTNAEAHLYLGWALLEVSALTAEVHLKRALELDHLKSVRAHLALARLAHSQGNIELAIKHLNEFLPRHRSQRTLYQPVGSPKISGPDAKLDSLPDLKSVHCVVVPIALRARASVTVISSTYSPGISSGPSRIRPAPISRFMFFC